VIGFGEIAFSTSILRGLVWSVTASSCGAPNVRRLFAGSELASQVHALDNELTRLGGLWRADL
jgi:hypothetical protein